MKRLVPLTIAMLCALVIGLGCGDDETTTITQYDTLIQTVTITDSFTDTVSSPLVVTKAFASIGETFEMTASVYQTTQRVVVLDSVFAADSVCRIEPLYDMIPRWARAYFLHYYDNGPRFDPGDTAEFRFYAEGTLSTARVKLLDMSVDPIVIEPATPDSVGVDDPIEIHWSPIEHADWYGIVVTRFLASDMFDFWDYFNYFSYDTTITIPADLIDENGHLDFWLLAATGPSPSDQVENITGGLVGGSIFSQSGIGGFGVKIGTGMPVRAEKPVATPEPEAAEILDRLLESHPTER